MSWTGPHELSLVLFTLRLLTDPLHRFGAMVGTCSERAEPRHSLSYRARASDNLVEARCNLVLVVADRFGHILLEPDPDPVVKPLRHGPRAAAKQE